MAGKPTAGSAAVGDVVGQEPATIVVRPGSVGGDGSGVVIALLPMAVVFLVAQRFIAREITSGEVT